ncbi:hypothetical protein [Shewanella surugensis]|uniref:DUF3135 domain-containing protein n=1 Tax=Shewanella surugensis TaxID=212020 RepID=A0ABT0L9U3_9GAMM|nr:hypothetical protein [Shewanella surugensis]MCL1124122.1 hypothetical protein [Shewanella surugensis]
MSANTLNNTQLEYDVLVNQAALHIQYATLLNNQLATAQAAVLKSLETENPLDCFNAMKNALSVQSLLDAVFDAHESNISAESFLANSLQAVPSHLCCINRIKSELTKTQLPKLNEQGAA